MLAPKKPKLNRAEKRKIGKEIWNKIEREVNQKFLCMFLPSFQRNHFSYVHISSVLFLVFEHAVGKWHKMRIVKHSIAFSMKMPNTWCVIYIECWHHPCRPTVQNENDGQVKNKYKQSLSQIDGTQLFWNLWISQKSRIFLWFSRFTAEKLAKKTVHSTCIK